MKSSRIETDAGQQTRLLHFGKVDDPTDEQQLPQAEGSQRLGSAAVLGALAPT